MKKVIFSILVCLSLISKSQPNLVYDGKDKHLKSQIDYINNLLKSDEFYNEISKYERFYNTEYSGKEIATILRNANIDIVVKYKLLPLCNASTTDSKCIKLSRLHFDNKTNIGINTLVHELVHAVDFMDDELDFTHSSNNNDDHSQDNTVPWVVGLIAENYVSK